MELGDRVMDAERRATYVTERKLFDDPNKQREQLELLRNVVLFNGMFSGEARDAIGKADVEEYQPKRSEETHFWDPETGTLYAHNARGDIRLKRDTEQARVLREMTGRELGIDIRHYKGDAARASNRFTKFAQQNVDKVFRKLPLNDIMKKEKLFVLMGPHDSVPTGMVDMEPVLADEYLKTRILRVGENVIVNWDYIFGDQIDSVLRQFYLMCNAKLPGIDLHVSHYGRVGALSPHVHIGDICIPVDAYEEESVNGGQHAYPLQNMLYHDKGLAERFDGYLRESGGKKLSISNGNTNNTTSVLNQTHSMLRGMRVSSAFIEMEWLAMALVLKGHYPNIRSINRYYVGIASDEPLMGKNLSNTPYPKENERAVAKSLLRVAEHL